MISPFMAISLALTAWCGGAGMSSGVSVELRKTSSIAPPGLRSNGPSASQSRRNCGSVR